MIHLTHSVSGSEVGGQLQDDPEELAYTLAAIAEGMDDELGEEVAAHVWTDAQGPIVALLENLLAALQQ